MLSKYQLPDGKRANQQKAPRCITAKVQAETKGVTDSHRGDTTEDNGQN